MRARAKRRWRRPAAATLALTLLIVLGAHPLAGAASDIWGNVGPASQVGSGGIAGRYPLSHYALDQQFDAISASLTGGVDASGVAPMIAFFLAAVLWALTSFLASALIALFGFAFSLDLLNGSGATGGAGALAPVSAAIHAIYSDVFGAPWLVLAVALVGIWAMWKALVQRRYSETAGALGLSLIYVVLALFFVAQPARTIGSASEWTNRMSVAFLSISAHGSASGGAQAKDDAADQLFDLLVFKPWVVLDFGGVEHCVLAGSGSGDSDPESVAVRPLSSDPARDAALARRLGSGGEVSADGKVCVNNAEKYGSHFLRFGIGTDERDAEYDALNSGDSSKLPEADTARAGYRLGVADKPATDAMEEGGQYERLLIAIVVFIGELGAFCLLGSLSAAIVLAQILLLLLLAFAPVALVAAAIPGRGHDFFKGWLEKLAGYLLRKAAYSLVLAVVLAVNGALASATDQLGWLMSFGLQALFFWAVFLQRKTLAGSLIGIATGPKAPGRDASLKLLSVYASGRMAGRIVGPLRRGARSAGAGNENAGGGSGRRRAPLFGTSVSRQVGSGSPGPDVPGSVNATPPPASTGDDVGRGQERRRAGMPDAGSPASGGEVTAERVGRRGGRADSHTAAVLAAEEAEAPPPGKPWRPARTDKAEARRGKQAPERSSTAEKRSPAKGKGTRHTEPRAERGQSREVAEPTRKAPPPTQGEDSLGAELRAERERGGESGGEAPVADGRPDRGGEDSVAPRRRKRHKGGER